jgi:hypothetical protein
MWAILSSPDHIASFAQLGEDWAPMQRLATALSEQPYAPGLWAFTSLASFNLTTAEKHGGRDGHDVVHIEFDPRQQSFRIEYHEWVSGTRNPPHRVAASRQCPEEAAFETVELYVLRLLLLRREDAALLGAGGGQAHAT